MLTRRIRPVHIALGAIAVVIAALAIGVYLQQRSPDRWFAPESVWNRELADDAPLAPDSDVLSDKLDAMVDGEMSSGDGPWMNIDEWSSPVYEVGGAQRTVEVELLRPRVEDTKELHEAFEAVPIPEDAQPADGRDAHMVIWQPSTDTMWEFWRAAKTDDGWVAEWGARIDDVSSHPGYFQGDKRNWGASATSLPIVGGMVTFEDLERGEIDHALALALPNTDDDEWVWPAQRTDGDDTSDDAIPAGTRFRLPADLDLESMDLPPLTMMLAKAAQRYGMIVRDRSGIVTVYGEDPKSRDDDPFEEIIGEDSIGDVAGAFPWKELQVVAVAKD